jgi:hypothetical protein
MLFVLVAKGCAAPAIDQALQKAQAPASAPKLLAVYMPWFGDHTTKMLAIPARTL